MYLLAHFDASCQLIMGVTLKLSLLSSYINYNKTFIKSICPMSQKKMLNCKGVRENGLKHIHMNKTCIRDKCDNFLSKLHCIKSIQLYVKVRSSARAPGLHQTASYKGPKMTCGQQLKQKNKLSKLHINENRETHRNHIYIRQRPNNMFWSSL